MTAVIYFRFIYVLTKATVLGLHHNIYDSLRRPDDTNKRCEICKLDKKRVLCRTAARFYCIVLSSSQIYV